MAEISFSGWLGLTFGLILAIAGTKELRKYSALLRRSRRVQATVVGMERSVGGLGGAAPQYRYHPVLKFTTAEGRKIEARTKLGTSPPAAREGDRVTATYDPQDPERVDIAGKGGISLAITLLLTLFGFFLLAVFVYSLFV